MTSSQQATLQIHDSAPAGPRPTAEDPSFSLLAGLPALQMQRIVQHLDAGDCLALLRTSRQLGSAVQHRGALTWTWRAPPDAEPNSMQTPQVATAASLLARWAPAELHVRLHGRVTPATKTGTAFSLPATLPPLITRLHLSCMHLTPKAMGSLLHCRRLHTLDIERCTHAAAELQQVALPALPLLHAVRYQPAAPQDWALYDLGALCAHAADFSVKGVPAPFALPLSVLQLLWDRVTTWDLGGAAPLSSDEVQGLLVCPRVRHVGGGNLVMWHDASQQACQWDEVTVRTFNGVADLLRLPVGIRRLVVTTGFTCRCDEDGGVEAVLQRWEPGTVVARPAFPPPSAEFWRLSEQERLLGFFSLALFHETGVADHLQFLEEVVFPPGGGPHVLELRFKLGTFPTQALRQLAPLLAGSCVRVLCVWLEWGYNPEEGLLSVLPTTIACLRLRTSDAEDVAAALHGPRVAHALRLVALLPRAPSAEAGAFETQQLRVLCAAQQPMVALEVLRLD